MLLCRLFAPLAIFLRTFIIKGNASNGRKPPFCPFPIIAFINKEDIGAIKEVVIGAIVAPRNLSSYFFI